MLDVTGFTSDENAILPLSIMHTPPHPRLAPSHWLKFQQNARWIRIDPPWSIYRFCKTFKTFNFGQLCNFHVSYNSNILFRKHWLSQKCHIVFWGASLRWKIIWWKIKSSITWLSLNNVTTPEEKTMRHTMPDADEKRNGNRLAKWKFKSLLLS